MGTPQRWKDRRWFIAGPSPADAKPGRDDPSRVRIGGDDSVLVRDRNQFLQALPKPVVDDLRSSLVPHMPTLRGYTPSEAQLLELGRASFPRPAKGRWVLKHKVGALNAELEQWGRRHNLAARDQAETIIGAWVLRAAVATCFQWAAGNDDGRIQLLLCKSVVGGDHPAGSPPWIRGWNPVEESENAFRARVDSHVTDIVTRCAKHGLKQDRRFFGRITNEDLDWLIRCHVQGTTAARIAAAPNAAGKRTASCSTVESTVERLRIRLGLPPRS